MEDKKNMINKDKLGSERKFLKRDFKIYIACYVGLLIISPIVYYIKNDTISVILGIPAIIMGLTLFILRFVLLFRIRYVYKPMGKSLTTITLFQLGLLFIPFGDIIFPAIVLNESNKAILA